MIRINLLPPEITDKRKAERRWYYVVLGAVGIYLVLAVFWFVMFLQVTAKSADVGAKMQEAQALQQQASSFKVFEDRQADLKARQATVDKALTGRREWSKLFTELALVLPADAWLEKLHVDEKAFQISGQSLAPTGDEQSSGFKPVAKLLVHMADLQDLENVWLGSSNKSQVLSQDTVTFDITADISQVATKTAGAPAPPSGQ